MRACRLLLLAGISVFALGAATWSEPGAAAESSSLCSGSGYPVTPWCPGDRPVAPGPGGSGGADSGGGSGDDDDDDDDDDDNGADDDDDDDDNGADDDDNG